MLCRWLQKQRQNAIWGSDIRFLGMVTRVFTALNPINVLQRENKVRQLCLLKVE